VQKLETGIKLHKKLALSAFFGALCDSQNAECANLCVAKIIFKKKRRQKRQNFKDINKSIAAWAPVKFSCVSFHQTQEILPAKCSYTNGYLL
jgi:hypothetical protein